MSSLTRGARQIVEHCMAVKSGQEVLILIDDAARPMRWAQEFMEAVASVGGKPVLGVIATEEMHHREPPRSIAAAMQGADVILNIFERYGVGHTTARHNSSALGIPFFVMMTRIGEDYLARDFRLEDLEAIRDRTEAVADRFSQASLARMTTPLGTDLTVSLAGRSALALHPFARVLAWQPDYAEAAIAPVEGTANGTIVIDSHMAPWGYLLREPLRVRVEAGRCVEITGEPEEARRLRTLVFENENAANCPAELAIGTSHIIPSSMLANRWHAGRCGLVHIAFGRNEDLGGTVVSEIHIDGVINNATIELDGKTLLKNGVLELE